jgi:hypothetical protein
VTPDNYKETHAFVANALHAPQTQTIADMLGFPGTTGGILLALLIVLAILIFATP